MSTQFLYQTRSSKCSQVCRTVHDFAAPSTSYNHICIPRGKILYLIPAEYRAPPTSAVPTRKELNGDQEIFSYAEPESRNVGTDNVRNGPALHSIRSSNPSAVLFAFQRCQCNSVRVVVATRPSKAYSRPWVVDMLRAEALYLSPSQFSQLLDLSCPETDQFYLLCRKRSKSRSLSGLVRSSSHHGRLHRLERGKGYSVFRQGVHRKRSKF
jgi:hypothetical protein